MWGFSKGADAADISLRSVARTARVGWGRTLTGTPTHRVGRECSGAYQRNVRITVHRAEGGTPRRRQCCYLLYQQ